MEASLQQWVRNYLSHLLGIPAASIAFDKTLADFGLDSVDAVLMAGELEQAFGAEIDPASFIQYDDFAAMITGLARTLEDRA